MAEMSENVKTFILCGHHRKLLAHMNAEQKAELLDALFAYNDDEEIEIEDPLVDTVFMVMSEAIDRMRKFNAKQRENGAKGGRPKTQQNPEKPKITQINPDKPSDTQQKPLMEMDMDIKENTNVFLSKSPDFDASTTQGSLVETPSEASTSKYPRCPQEKILNLYREILPELSQPRQIRPNIATQVRARWLEKCKEKGFATEEEGLAYFRKFFSYVAGNDFLTGRKNTCNGKAWRCDYAWLMKAANFDKVTGDYYGGQG